MNSKLCCKGFFLFVLKCFFFSALWVYIYVVSINSSINCKYKLAGETEAFEDSFADSDYSAGAIALSFYSGFWAYSGW